MQSLTVDEALDALADGCMLSLGQHWSLQATPVDGRRGGAWTYYFACDFPGCCEDFGTKDEDDVRETVENYGVRQDDPEIVVAALPWRVS